MPLINRRKWLSLVASGCVLSAFGNIRPVFAETLSLSAAINKSGRQRMLSQRMAKAWLMILLDVDAARGQEILQQSMHLFDSQLAEMNAYIPNESVRTSRADLVAEWGLYKNLLQTKPDLAGAAGVYRASDTVLHAADALTKAYAASATAASSSVASLINIAGRQRMLSQRMAKFYFFALAKVNEEDALEKMKQAADEFSQAQKKLAEAPENSPRIRAELKLTDQQFWLYSKAVHDIAKGKGAAQSVSSASENILSELDGIVGQYEAL